MWRYKFTISLIDMCDEINFIYNWNSDISKYKKCFFFFTILLDTILNYVRWDSFYANQLYKKTIRTLKYNNNNKLIIVFFFSFYSSSIINLTRPRRTTTIIIILTDANQLVRKTLRAEPVVGVSGCRSPSATQHTYLTRLHEVSRRREKCIKKNK